MTPYSSTNPPHDPNLTAGRPDELLVLIPHMADVPKVKAWLIDVHKATILYESHFEPVYLHIRVAVETARMRSKYLNIFGFLLAAF
jgi:hypothetical protein